MQILARSIKDTDSVQPDDDLNKIFKRITSILYSLHGLTVVLIIIEYADHCNFKAFFCLHFHQQVFISDEA